MLLLSVTCRVQAATAQTITFGALDNAALSVGTVTLTATASSGLTLTFTSTTPSVCTVSGNTVTLAALGACSITASQAGNGTFSAAAPVTQTFSVNQGYLITTVAGGAGHAVVQHLADSTNHHLWGSQQRNVKRGND